MKYLTFLIFYLITCFSVKAQDKAFSTAERVKTMLQSIAEILFGVCTPSGRLNVSFPRSAGHLPVSELALYDSRMNRRVEPGEFVMQIGAASDKLFLNKSIHVSD
jgi:hypothetical protein